jgi:hypothetical protein
MTSALISHILDTVHGSFLIIDHNSINIAAKNNRDSQVILALSGLAQISQSAVEPRIDLLQVL